MCINEKKNYCTKIEEVCPEKKEEEEEVDMECLKISVHTMSGC